MLYVNVYIPSKIPDYVFEPQREIKVLSEIFAHKDANQPAHPHEDILHPWLSKKRPVKFLIRLRECAGCLNLRWAHMAKGTFTDVSAYFIHVHISYMYIKYGHIHIILRMRKVLSGPLLSIHILCSIQ